MQTILGATGPVGTALAKALTAYTTNIRLVSRQPKKVNETDELVAADLTQKEAVHQAVKGSEVVYLTAGLLYKTKVWQQQWPVIMRNVIDACKAHGSKLVFFDNMYMYDPAHLHHLTEEAPVRPVSKKGAVRAQIAQMIWNEVKVGTLQAQIVRAADFISTKNSVLVEMIAKNLARGKKAMWMVDVNKVHHFTYVPDAAKATALLGNTPDAYNQVWHLPTASERLTGKQWMEKIAAEIGVPLRYTVLSKTAMGLLGIFVPVLREFKELAYQYEMDYVFDASKFTNRFGIYATPPQQAISEVIQELGLKR